MLELPVITKTCGGCTECCRAIGIKELGKPYYVKCAEQCESGCKVYEKKPQSCSDFQCVWYSGVFGLDEAHRPDKVGYVLDLCEDTTGIWVEVFLTRDWGSIDMPLLVELVEHAISVLKTDGARVYRDGQVVPVAFPIGSGYPDLGETGKMRDFKSTDGHIWWHLAPVRPQ